MQTLMRGWFRAVSLALALLVAGCFGSGGSVDPVETERLEALATLVAPQGGQDGWLVSAELGNLIHAISFRLDAAPPEEVHVILAGASGMNSKDGLYVAGVRVSYLAETEGQGGVFSAHRKSGSGTVTCIVESGDRVMVALPGQAAKTMTHSKFFDFALRDADIFKNRTALDGEFRDGQDVPLFRFNAAKKTVEIQHPNVAAAWWEPELEVASYQETRTRPAQGNKPESARLVMFAPDGTERRITVTAKGDVVFSAQVPGAKLDDAPFFKAKLGRNPFDTAR